MMKKQSYELEMEHIKDWCVTILDFIAVKNPDFKQFSELTKDNLIKYYKSNNKKLYTGFQQSYRDINEMAKTLSPSDFQELNFTLKERFGKDLKDTDTVVDKKIEKILKKGKISNPTEYELLLNRVEEIYADKSKEQEVKRLNELLAAYHQ